MIDGNGKLQNLFERTGLYLERMKLLLPGGAGVASVTADVEHLPIGNDVEISALHPRNLDDNDDLPLGNHDVSRRFPLQFRVEFHGASSDSKRG